MAQTDYQFLDHTADIGIQFSAPSLKDLFQSAGQAFCDLVCDSQTVKPEKERLINLSRPNAEALLQAFLSELLFIFETEHFLFSEVTLNQISESDLQALVKGEKIDFKRHAIKTGIKAVTWHQLFVRQETKTLWKAQVIFDV